MAGGWGYEPDHYDVSMACGERVLLPKVREASPETLVVADGFSCRSQIEQGDTGRGALHVAEVIKLAREQGSIPAYPERALSEGAPRRLRVRRVALALGVTAALAGATAAYLSK
jgi:hypothetical protein